MTPWPMCYFQIQSSTSTCKSQSHNCITHNSQLEELSLAASSFYYPLGLLPRFAKWRRHARLECPGARAANRVDALATASNWHGSGGRARDHNDIYTVYVIFIRLILHRHISLRTCHCFCVSHRITPYYVVNKIKKNANTLNSSQIDYSWLTTKHWIENGKTVTYSTFFLLFSRLLWLYRLRSELFLAWDKTLYVVNFDYMFLGQLFGNVGQNSMMSIVIL
jgi:hypothetical protein